MMHLKAQINLILTYIIILKKKQFINESHLKDLSQYIKVNYPNFEIIILDAYINLFMQGIIFVQLFGIIAQKRQLILFSSNN